MKLCPILGTLLGACVTLLAFQSPAQKEVFDPADVIIHNAKVITVDSEFGVAQAIAVRSNRIVAVGSDRDLEKYKSVYTLVIDAHGLTVMPGLYDANVQSLKASTSELNGPLVAPASIEEALAYIRRQSTNLPAGTWITLDWPYPTRLKEERLPTKAELDLATTNNPVFWNFGTLAMVNSKALEVSKITKDTPSPMRGEVVKDRKTLKPTGLLRKSAISLVKLPKPANPPTREKQIEALKRLYHFYNQQGITSIGEGGVGPQAVDLLRDMGKAGDLTVRVNYAWLLENITNVDEAVARIDALTNAAPGKKPYGPTGVGDDWVRAGALKTILDGDLSMATAYLRTPYGIGPTYKITEPAYRGELKQDPYMLPEVLTEAAQRGWQLSGFATGDAALDFLLNCYEKVQFKTNISERRFIAMHSEFQASQHWERIEKLGVVANADPAALYEDGASLLNTLGEPRLTNFLRLKSWFDRELVVGAGSSHLAGTNSLGAANPWNPWLGMWASLTRATTKGEILNPDERLTREQAIQLYTWNNAYLNFEEHKKGSLEPGKLADLIMIDRDILKCPVDGVRNTRVVLTMVNGKIVWEARELFVPVAQPPIFTATDPAPTYAVTNLLTTLVVTNQVPAVATNDLAAVAATNETPAIAVTTVTNVEAEVAVTNAGPVITITNQVTTIIVTNAQPVAVATADANTVATNTEPNSVVTPNTVVSAEAGANQTVASATTTNVAAAPVASVTEAGQAAAQPQTSSDWSQVGAKTNSPVATTTARPTPAQIPSAQPTRYDPAPATPIPGVLQVRARTAQPTEAVPSEQPVPAPVTAPAVQIPAVVPAVGQPAQVPAVQAKPSVIVTPQVQAVPQVQPASAPVQPIQQPTNAPVVQPQASPDQPPPATAVQFHPSPTQPRK